ncbi:RodZ domain-containing protein [Pseudothauera lacus]|nr:RodZ domain-containing protein [Pseudothauera lacus]
MSEASQFPQEASAVAEQPGVGEMLRAAREARGLTVANVAQMLKLGVRQIEAMEAGRFDLLPGPAFVRGFVRNYARILGIDAAPLQAALGNEPPAGNVELVPVSNADGEMPSGGESRMSSTPVAVVAFGLLLVVLVGWYFDWFRTPQPIEVVAPLVAGEGEPLFAPPLDDEPAAGQGAAGVMVESVEAPPQAPVETAVQPPPAVPDTAAPATPATGMARLTFRFAGESWFEVRDAGGALLVSATGQAGQVRTVDGQPPFAVVVGNAREVRLERNGRSIDLVPHTRVSVARLSVE